MTYDVTPIVQALITLCAAIITAFVIPYLKNKVGSEKMDLMLQWVKVAVAAAEQLFETDQAKEKKDYVLNFLERQNIKVNEDELDKAIEAAVLELHNTLYGTTK